MLRGSEALSACHELGGGRDGRQRERDEMRAGRRDPEFWIPEAVSWGAVRSGSTADLEPQGGGGRQGAYLSVTNKLLVSLSVSRSVERRGASCGRCAVLCELGTAIGGRRVGLKRERSERAREMEARIATECAWEVDTCGRHVRTYAAGRAGGGGQRLGRIEITTKQASN